MKSFPSLVLFFALTACMNVDETESTTQDVVCYDTGNGVQCVEATDRDTNATPDLAAVDDGAPGTTDVARYGWNHDSCCDSSSSSSSCCDSSSSDSCCDSSSSSSSCCDSSSSDSCCDSSS